MIVFCWGGYGFFRGKVDGVVDGSGLIYGIHYLSDGIVYCGLRAIDKVSDAESDEAGGGHSHPIFGGVRLFE